MVSDDRIMMLMVNAFFALYSVILFLSFFGTFLLKKISMKHISGILLFAMWQISLPFMNFLSAQTTICVSCFCTFLSATWLYQGRRFEKLLCAIVFNTLWMLIETLTGNMLLIYFPWITDSFLFEISGSLISKSLFLLLIIGLKHFYSKDIIQNIPTKYNIVFSLIPVGSISIANFIFEISHKMNVRELHMRSAVLILLLLLMNLLTFYVFSKIADYMQIKYMNTIYVKQIELSKRQQEETELSIYRFKDLKHNIKNSFITILKYAENKECENIITFIRESLGESEIRFGTSINSGNVVIDSLLNYWENVAKKEKIKFDASVLIPIDMNFRNADLSLMVGNLVENAVEAAASTKLNRYINIKMKYDRNNLLFYIENGYSHMLLKNKKGELQSTKNDPKNHGIGLSSVNRVVSKYHGFLSYDTSTDGIFRVSIVLYGENDTNNG